MSAGSSCIICLKQNACVECCGVNLCLLDFFGSIHASHPDKAKITNKEQFRQDIAFCREVGRVTAD